MKERKITSDQKRRIEAIKEAWLKELREIPEPELTRWPDISLNEPYRKLEKNINHRLMQLWRRTMAKNDMEVIPYKILSYLYECMKLYSGKKMAYSITEGKRK